jgi:L-fuculose-phosphate aldolase
MLDDLKKEVLRIAQLAESAGLCQHGSGNFSLIDRETQQFAITPHSESRFSLSYEDILIVSISGEIVENLGGHHPSSETLIHREVLKARPDISAVCHTHARNAAVFAALGKPIKPAIIEALFYGGVCGVAPYALPGTPELAVAAVAGLKDSQATLLERHGVITVGKSLYDAYLSNVYVDELAEINIKLAGMVGYDNIPALSEEELDRLMRHMGMKS